VRLVVLPTWGNMQPIQAQSFGQSLVGEGLFGKHGRHPIGTLVALRRVEQNELLNLAQLFQGLCCWTM
jgi:hypothetical protein